MKKIVINNCFGGFGLSQEGIDRYKEISNKDYTYYDDIPRDDPALIQVIEELGEEANGFCAHLSIIEIPDDVEWQIEEYDGNEWVAEKHRTWG